MPDIKEKINEVSPIKEELSNIAAYSDPSTGCIAVNIDADIVTLGVVAKLLSHRYQVNLNGFVSAGRVPADTDAHIQAIVTDYICSGREKITIVRKDKSNG